MQQFDKPDGQGLLTREGFALALILKNTANSQTIIVPIVSSDIGQLFETQWLLSNTRGGFCCGTVAGCNTSRYHGLLVGSLNPPASRIVTLSSCRETITLGGSEVELGTFEFEGKLSTAGLEYAVEFRRDVGVHFDYAIGAVELTKSVYLLPDSDTAAIAYDFTSVGEEFDFTVRPLAAMRDFHSLQKSDAAFETRRQGSGLVIKAEQDGRAELLLASEQMTFQDDRQWWHNFLYRKERERGLDYLEDLWSPGIFKCHIDSPVRLILWANLSESATTEDMSELDLDVIVDSLVLREKELILMIKGFQFRIFESNFHGVNLSLLAPFHCNALRQTHNPRKYMTSLSMLFSSHL